jgi:hypothetical protein
VTFRHSAKVGSREGTVLISEEGKASGSEEGKASGGEVEKAWRSEEGKAFGNVKVKRREVRNVVKPQKVKNAKRREEEIKSREMKVKC